MQRERLVTGSRRGRADVRPPFTGQEPANGPKNSTQRAEYKADGFCSSTGADKSSVW